VSIHMFKTYKLFFLFCNRVCLADYVKLLTEMHCSSLIWSLFHDKAIFGIFLIGLREAAEFHNYQFVAPSVFYKYMFKFKSPGH
jgi:hypothetical protein